MHRRLVLAALVLISSALLTIDHRSPNALSPLREAGAGIYGPAENGVALVQRTIVHAVRGTVDGTRLQDQNQALKLENQRLRRQIWQNRRDMTRLERFAGLKRERDGKLVPANVVAVDGREAVTIDAGARQGVRREMTVITKDGLVGRVGDAGPSASTVLLVSTSSIGVRVRESGEIGVLTDGTRLRLLNTEVRLRPGHTVETFGSKKGLPYAAGVPIGKITTNRDEGTATVRPFVRLTALDLVGVVIGE